MLARRHGKLTFLVIRDRGGDLQLFCEEATLGDGYGLLDEIDLGDIVGATGHVVRTRRGELSLKVDTLTLLTKALRPLPEKWHGLQDPDLQQRRRYLHLITDPAPRRYVAARATVLRTIRQELDGRGYTEVETPILQPVAGGALAKPFTTHHNALDTDLKLRISLELYLKRLLVGGLERDLRDGSELPQRGHRPGTQPGVHDAGAVRGVRRLRDDDADRRGPDPRVRDGVARLPRTPVPGRFARPGAAVPSGDGARFVSEATGDTGRARARSADAPRRSAPVSLDPVWGAGKIALELFEKLVEQTIFEPTFVCDFPREVSPLARPHRSDPALTEHFDVIVGGVDSARRSRSSPIRSSSATKFRGSRSRSEGGRRRRGASAG